MTLNLHFPIQQTNCGTCSGSVVSNRQMMHWLHNETLKAMSAISQYDDS